ncbi:MAG: putative Ubiquitin carboxyl-terminal hydrolase [Streblomastix strix]|uniref:Putative Ubiquitin carboxyl-terminal hydrolase n=1 Tax=Streblomastix strix TaxID=222440 RepID=A0A5J4X136_9EUKA|nr:MAG: putative Ubiquitin carboxyl-terminal hydrolase [Streblomastix strix]
MVDIPTPFTFIKRDDVQKQMDEIIKGISELTNISTDEAILLLISQEWDQERLTNQFVDDKDSLFLAAGIISDSPIESSIETQDCKICIQPLKPGNITYLPCGHQFCSDCFGKLIQTRLLDGYSSFQIACPGVNCIAKIYPSKIMEVLDFLSATQIGEVEIQLIGTKASDEYKRFLQDHYIKSQKDQFVFCPNVGCSQIIQRKQGFFQKDVKCLCGKLFCFDCGLDQHPAITCQLKRESVKESQRNSTAEYQQINDEVQETSRDDHNRNLIQKQLAVHGLVNLGNTCYFNSGLQCLASVVPLSSEFLSMRYIQDLNINSLLGWKGKGAYEYSEFIWGLWGEGSGAVRPERMKNVHEDLNRAKNKATNITSGGDFSLTEVELASQARQYMKYRSDSFISELFYGESKSTIDCVQCQHRSVQFNTTGILCLPIPMEQRVAVHVTWLPLQLKDEDDSEQDEEYKEQKISQEKDEIKMEEKNIKIKVQSAKPKKPSSFLGDDTVWQVMKRVSEIVGVGVGNLVALDIFHGYFYGFYEPAKPLMRYS